MMDFDTTTGAYQVIGPSGDATAESTWRLICEMGALSTEPRSVTEIGRKLGIEKNGKLSGTQRKQIANALRDRPDVGVIEDIVRGQKTRLYRRLGGAA